MSVVSLVSGGLDSTLMALLIRERGLAQHPLFVNYGQRSLVRELSACRAVFRKFKLPRPKVIDIAGYGHFIGSGLTNARMRVFEDAFLPGRNLMFLLLGAAYAYRVNATSVSIGLLNDSSSIFPDQTKPFIDEAEKLLTNVLGRDIKVLSPLMSFSKSEVVQVAGEKGIHGTYSCHAGGAKPCGLCVACREFNFKVG